MTSVTGSFREADSLRWAVTIRRKIWLHWGSCPVSKRHRRVVLPTQWWHATFDIASWTVGIGSTTGWTEDNVQLLFRTARDLPPLFLDTFVQDSNVDWRSLLFVLQEAVRTGHVTLVTLTRALLTQFEAQSWLTILAAVNGHSDVLQLLLDHGASIPNAAELMKFVSPQHSEAIPARFSPGKAG